MTLVIGAEDPLAPDSLTLIKGSEAALREVYTTDECFTFSPAELTRPGITFFVARLNGTPMGCVALCIHDAHAEVKRLFVLPRARGSGTGRALMQHLETVAGETGHQTIRLETGIKLTAGVALYRALGYNSRGPFGDYIDHPTSLFLEKTL